MKRIRKSALEQVHPVFSFADVCMSQCYTGVTCPDCSQCMGNVSVLQTRRDNASAAVANAKESKRKALTI